MNTKIFAVLALCLCATLARAAEPGAGIKRVEASMLLTGSIDIEQDGSVSGYHVEPGVGVTPEVRKLLAHAVNSWRFEPVLVEGVPRKVQADMRLRLKAEKAPEDYQVRIASAHFGSRSDGESPTGALLAPPAYPNDLARRYIGGTVYLVLKVGRDGRVQETIAEQVNLRAPASGKLMAKYRDRLARAALRAAADWTFNIPVAGPEADHTSWSVRVPVDFLPYGTPEIKAGYWYTYVPGPRATIPWVREDPASYASPDTQMAGGVYSLHDTGPKLLTSLDPS